MDEPGNRPAHFRNACDVKLHGSNVAALPQSVLQPPAVVGIGAGTLVATGLIAVFFALAGSRLTVEKKSVPTDDISIAPLTPDHADPESQRPWPPRTSRKIPD
jgi:hypothetical protein